MERQRRTRRRMRLAFGFIFDIVLCLPRLLIAVVVSIVSVLVTIVTSVMSFVWRLKWIAVTVLVISGVAWYLCTPVYFGQPIYFGNKIPYESHTIAKDIDEGEDIQELFKENSTMKNIKLAESVNNIWMNGFQGAESLEKIEVTDIFIIEDYAFQGCESLESVKLSNETFAIDQFAFADCKSLKNVEGLEGLTKIQDYAFHGCESLENIEIPAGVTCIQSGTFSDCKSLKDIKLSEGLTNIENYAFYGCESLEHIELPNTLTSISGGAFRGCTMLTNIKFPEGWESVNGELFDISSDNFAGMQSSNGHIYLIYAADGVDSWNVAKEYCEQLGGHLATITSYEESRDVIELLCQTLCFPDRNSDECGIDNEHLRCYTIAVDARACDGLEQDGKWMAMDNLGGGFRNEDSVDMSKIYFICEWEANEI